MIFWEALDEKMGFDEHHVSHFVFSHWRSLAAPSPLLHSVSLEQSVLNLSVRSGLGTLQGLHRTALCSPRFASLCLSRDNTSFRAFTLMPHSVSFPPIPSTLPFSFPSQFPPLPFDIVFYQKFCILLYYEYLSYLPKRYKYTKFGMDTCGSCSGRKEGGHSSSL